MSARVKTVIVIYSLIGFVLFLIGIIGLYQLYVGDVRFEGIKFYGVIVALVFAVFLGLHWFIVGLASLREG